MTIVNSKAVTAFGKHVFSLFLFYSIISFIVTRNIYWILSSGILLTLVSIAIIWQSSSSRYSSQVNWLTENEDPLTFEIVNGLLNEEGVKIHGIAVLNYDIPNAFILSWRNFKPVVFYTQDLLHRLEYNEVRAVTKFLFGLTKSNSMAILTYFSSLMHMSLRLIDTTIKTEDMNIVKKITSAPGWFLFNVFWRMFIEVSEEAVTQAEKYINGDEYNKYYLSALVKIFIRYQVKQDKKHQDIDNVLKGLSFIDPSALVIDRGNLSKLLRKHDSILELGGVDYPPLKRIDEFMIQRPVHVRVENVIEKSHLPLKLDEIWIN
jgi:hypothetical protein